MQTFYTVRPGDTLSSIAKRWEVPIASLVAANRIASPDVIYPGQQLSVPSGVAKVRVKAGDSVYSLAQAYGVPTSVVIGANRLHPPYTIYVDQQLAIPPGVPYYTVQPGDTLYGLAGRYHVSTDGARRPELIREANRLPSDRIVVGMRLVIPYAPPGGFGQIAYISDREGTFDLWLYDPTSGRSAAIGGGRADRHSVPYWSPDGRHIAYVGKQGVLFVVDVQQGVVRQIDQIEPYTGMSWSSDGTRLAYVKGDAIAIYDVDSFAHRSIPVPGIKSALWFPSADDRLLYAASEPTGNDAFYEIRADGTARRPLPVSAAGPKNEVSLSPDGAYAAFTSPGASISIVYVANLATGGVYALTGGPMAKNYDPSWSPDGSAIVYSSNEYDDRKGYYSTVRIERPTGGAQRIVAASDCFATPVSWSPDGRAIAYLSGCGARGLASELWVVRLDFPAPVLAAGGAAAGEGIAITSARWSPKPMPPGPVAVYRNESYKVSFSYPAAWRQTSDTRYEGADGFFEISAVASELPFEALCREIANHPLQPFGSAPRIVPGRVQGEEACYIFASDDQSPELRRQSALLATYPEPVVIGEVVYPYFILWADREHLVSIASSLTFLK
ncbi:LysM peptidoglycan-binding domain-containing protein [Paenibacillus antri]|nr:LysM peptidoglycan-binding domain-containing protein [Paenibacillus antri]